ncbi:hypothetical protein F5888DRAFT_1697912 [Russula emetica]|nr:hypothetical protein F5888DRAFT_1697912 [Russula emetica]
MLLQPRNVCTRSYLSLSLIDVTHSAWLGLGLSALITTISQKSLRLFSTRTLIQKPESLNFKSISITVASYCIYCNDGDGDGGGGDGGPLVVTRMVTRMMVAVAVQ